MDCFLGLITVHEAIRVTTRHTFTLLWLKMIVVKCLHHVFSYVFTRLLLYTHLYQRLFSLLGCPSCQIKGRHYHAPQERGRSLCQALSFQQKLCLENMKRRIT